MNNSKFRIVVFISGRGSNMQALVKTIRDRSLPITVDLVLSDQSLAPGLDTAKSFGIKTAIVPRDLKTQSKEEFSENLYHTIAPLSPDLIVLAGFMRILDTNFISRFENKIINIHPSLLPAFPGLNVHQRVIKSGVKFSGCTVHYVIPEVDSGTIIGQAVVPVLSTDTAFTLEQRVLLQEHKLLPACVYNLAQGGGALKQDLLNSDDVLISLQTL